MITEQMHQWGLLFTLKLRERLAGIPRVANGDVEIAKRRNLAVALAADDAEKVYPLEPWERAEVRDLADRGKITDLIMDRGKG